MDYTKQRSIDTMVPNKLAIYFVVSAITSPGRDRVQQPPITVTRRRQQYAH